MIPKTIHYVWLSGDEKPELVKECLQSWRDKLPDFEIREWTMADVETINSQFLKDAIAARKWAFATDFLRFFIVYNYGGIYMDSDIFVHRDLTPLLDCKGFTSFEASGALSTEKKNGKVDFALEAAMFGAERHSEWIKNILEFYDGVKFKNEPSFFLSIIAPKVMWNRTLPFGLRRVMSFQLLKGDVRIYPADTLSCIADYSLYGIFNKDIQAIGKVNPLKFACHLCNNSWGWKPKPTIKSQVKDFIISLVGAETAVNMKRKCKSLINR